jgi:hypothetical protein
MIGKQIFVHLSIKVLKFDFLNEMTCAFWSLKLKFVIFYFEKQFFKNSIFFFV